MFTVTGRLHDSGQVYDVQVDDLVPVAEWGIVRGTAGALVLLGALEGRGVAASPTGPFFTLDRYDPEAILATLVEHTDVLATSGDVPDLTGDVPHGAKP